MDKRQVENWSERDVSEWLKSIGLKEEYITKLHEDEVTGPALKIYSEHDLKEIGMKPGQIKLFLRNRDTLLSQINSQEKAVDKEVTKQNTPHSTGSNITDPQSTASEGNERHIQQKANVVSQNKTQENNPSSPKEGEQTLKTKAESEYRTTKEPSRLGNVDKSAENKSEKSPSSVERPENIMQNKSVKGARKQDRGNMSENSPGQHIQGVAEKTNSPEYKNKQKQVETSEKNKTSEEESNPHANISQSESIPQSHQQCVEKKDKQNPCTASKSGHLNQPPQKMSGLTYETGTTPGPKNVPNVSSELNPQKNCNVPLSVNIPESPGVSPENQHIKIQRVSSVPKPVNTPTQNIPKENPVKPQEKPLGTIEGGNLGNKRKKGKKSSSSEEKKPTENNSTEVNISTNKTSGQVDQQPQMFKQQEGTSQGDKKYQSVGKTSEKSQTVKETPENNQQNPRLQNTGTNTKQQNKGNHGQRQGNMAGLENRPGQSPLGKCDSKKTNIQKHVESSPKETIEEKHQHISLSETKAPQNNYKSNTEHKPIEPTRSSCSASKPELTQIPEKKSQQLQEIGTKLSEAQKGQSIANRSEKIIDSKANSLPPEKPSLKLSNFRPFGKHDINFKYVKNQVLPPETGIVDLIIPCHEYKSFSIAATLDKPRLLAKLRYETFRFAAACLNVRSNGTIHFGIRDSVEDKGYTHGQIVGIPIRNKDWYADVLNDLDKSFPEASEHAAAAMCIRSPQFIEVIDIESEEKAFVVEVDIEPLLISVKEKMFQVSLPKFDENKNKTFYEKKMLYERVGTKSQSVKIEDELNAFSLRLKEADKRRKEAEDANLPETQRYENLGRKLSVLTTNGKQYFDDTLQYILVTNTCQRHQLEHITFLKYLKILCVFDFDADSDIDGLYSKCTEYHATNIYSLQSYANEYGKNMDDIINKLGLFKCTSWVFCNGRKNFMGEDPQYDEHTWIKEKGKFFKKAVSLICDYIIKRGSFIVLFMLFSPVEKPMTKAFIDFYEEMSGMEYITCITDNTEYYGQWAGLVQASCNRTELDQRSVVGMMWGHINATIQDMIPKKDFYRKLPVSTKAVCVLKVPKEEKMNSLNILCLNECENTNHKAIDPNKLESEFYRGGRISWKHFWLAEQKKCGAFIERHACQEVEEMLDGILNKETVKLPVARINIIHQPGSGGSTVARQILWKNKKKLRCAIVNSTYLVSRVCEHAVQLREYEEKDISNCLPVLLLLEDCTEEYMDELKNKLQEAMVYKKVRSTKPCFILLSCRRSNAPEKFCAASPDDTVAITHKLKPKEQLLFKAKAEELNAIFSEDLIITFVLMSQEFNKKYLEDFVKNVLVDLDHSSSITRLIRYVALLNHYVQNSYISLSHCEVLLGVQSYINFENKLSQNQNLYSLREQALIIELKDESTFISAIRILHPMIAEEILNQLSMTYPQSKIALGLLQETAALNHRFGQYEFVTSIKHLFFRRHRKSRGDIEDSFFSPLIEHVCKEEKDTEMAIQLLRVAYEQFNKDAHFAQQLARIHYKNHKFEEAKKWVEIAKAKLPDDSYILDTEGRLYKEWFNVSYEKCKGKKNLPDEIGLIECGLKSMECFRNAQIVATFEKDTINNSGYFGEVDVGLNLVDLLLMLFNDNFNAENGKAELVKYLTTGKHIPEELKKPWFKVHSRLKSLYQHLYNALEWISEDIGYFQTDKIDVWESTTREDYHENNPRKWLVRKTKKFADYFCSQIQQDQSTSAQENQFSRKMAIYRYGGGSVATILSLLSNAKPEDPGSDLEKVISCYPREISEDKLDDDDLINLIMSHIALGSVCPGSTNLFSFQKLLEISQRFLNHQKIFPASAYFLLFMLYWPDEQFLTKQHANKTNIIKTAIETAKHLHQKRIKNVPVRKKRTNVLFFLGKGYGLQKFIFRGAIERLLKRPLNERTFRWDSDPKDREIIQTKLKKVDGWTENGRVYTKNPYGKEKIEVLPLNFASVPQGDENVTFYLGFTYIGYVTYGIKVNQEY